jgi:hypothetical protein
LQATSNEAFNDWKALNRKLPWVARKGDAADEANRYIDTDADSSALLVFVEQRLDVAVDFEDIDDEESECVGPQGEQKNDQKEGTSNNSVPSKASEPHSKRKVPKRKSSDAGSDSDYTPDTQIKEKKTCRVSERETKKELDKIA